MTNIGEIRKICTQFHSYSISNYYNETAVSIQQIYLNKYTVILDNYRYVEPVNDIIIN